MSLPLKYLCSLNCITVIPKANLKSHHVLSILTNGFSLLQLSCCAFSSAALSTPKAKPRCKDNRTGLCGQKGSDTFTFYASHRESHNYTLFSFKDILKPSNVICFKYTKSQCVKQIVRKFSNTPRMEM